MRVACTLRPRVAAALRALGTMLILVGLLAPSLAAAFVGTPGSQSRAHVAVDVLGSEFDGGACGEEEQLEELIDCGADLEARADEPFAIAVLRSTELRTTKQQCQELLADIWARQSCSIEGRECGTMNRGGLPGPAPELLSSSSSAHAGLAALGIDEAPVRRLAAPAAERMPKLPELSPPTPPPKLPRH